MKNKTSHSLSPLRGERARVRGFLFALFCLLAPALHAQDDAAAPPTNPADLKPRASEMAPLAAKTLLLGIARAGDHLVAVGDRGIVVTSSDGTDWTQVATPSQATLTALSFSDANNGWAVGHDSTVLHTADGGKTWTLQNYAPQTHVPLLSVLALDAKRALAAGAYGLFLETSDGGAHWTTAIAQALTQDGRHLNVITRLNDGTLFIAGENGLLGVSADGKDWKRTKLPYDGSIFGALPRGAKGATVFGLRGNVFVTDDVRSGKWTRIDSQTTQSMFGGAVLADGSIALVGADGEILLIGKGGAVKKARGPKDTRSLGSGTLSGVLVTKDGLLTVGELGASRVKQ